MSSISYLKTITTRPAKSFPWPAWLTYSHVHYILPTGIVKTWLLGHPPELLLLQRNSEPTMRGMSETLAPGVVKHCHFTVDAPSLSGILFSGKGGDAKCLAIRNGAA